MKLGLKIKLQKRKGFALIEVYVSSIILAGIMISVLVFSASAYQTTTNIRKKAVAQNLAQMTMEDIKAQPADAIDGLIASMYSPPAFILNYPLNGTIYDRNGGVGPDPSPVSGTYHIIATSQFIIDGITSFSSDGTLEIFSGENIPSLEAVPYSNYFKKSGVPVVSNYGPDSVYRYNLTNGIYLEPSEHFSNSAGLVLFGFKTTNFLREITVTRTSTLRENFNIIVKITWMTGLEEQTFEIIGTKTDVS